MTNLVEEVQSKDGTKATLVAEMKNHATGFKRDLGNGASALAHVAWGLEQVSQSNNRDTTILVKYISAAREKGDDVAASAVGFLTRQVFPKAKIAKDKNNNPVIKIKGIQPEADALAILRKLVEEKTSLRGTKVRSAFRTDDEEKSFDPKAWAERQAKSHDVKELRAMIAALQAAEQAKAK